MSNAFGNNIACMDRTITTRRSNTSLGTRAITQTEVQERDQERRAIANGALRFIQHSNEFPCAPANSEQRRLGNESTFPMVPVTVTQASGERCPHGTVARPSQRYNLDGTSPPPAPSYAAGQPAMLNQPSIESFRHRHHISRRVNKGTWRTRVGKTKCWRCELESRHTAAREAMYRRSRDIKGWAIRFKEKLRWTCLCRYVAYDDESVDMTRSRVVEERARLGRMGGNLT